MESLSQKKLSMYSLPTVIYGEILLHLPINELLHCSYLCKSFKIVIEKLKYSFKGIKSFSDGCISDKSWYLFEKNSMNTHLTNILGFRDFEITNNKIFTCENNKIEVFVEKKSHDLVPVFYKEKEVTFDEALFVYLKEGIWVRKEFELTKYDFEQNGCFNRFSSTFF